MKYKLIAVDENLEVTTLMDTGAGISLMKAKLAGRLNKEVFPVTDVSVQGVGGQIRPIGIAECEVTINGIRVIGVRFHIVNNEDFHGPEVLIGTDVIDHPQLILVRTQGVTTLVPNVEDWMTKIRVKSDVPISVTLRSQESVTLEPHQAHFLQMTSGNDDSQGFVISKSHPAGKEYYLQDGKG